MIGDRVYQGFTYSKVLHYAAEYSPTGGFSNVPGM